MEDNKTHAWQFNMNDKMIPESFMTTKVISSVVLISAFVFGLIVNSLYLWVLWFRMRRMVNTTWFFHLILASLIFTLIIPFFYVYIMMKPHWIFGLFMCKFTNFLVLVCMYGSVFILTTISLDRYCLVFHALWHKKHMNPRKASLICAALWTFALLFSSPYLVLRNVEYKKDFTNCYNEYTFSGKLDGQQVKWSLFGFRLLVAFIIPLGIVIFCYFRIFIKIKRKNMAKSIKPYKIILTAILSFFISWTPYHIWYGMTVESGRFSDTTTEIFLTLTIFFKCFNYCFTPIIYLFIVESFKNIFKNSVVALIESVFKETYTSGDRSLDTSKDQEMARISNI